MCKSTENMVLKSFLLLLNLKYVLLDEACCSGKPDDTNKDINGNESQTNEQLDGGMDFNYLVNLLFAGLVFTVIILKYVSSSSSQKDSEPGDDKNDIDDPDNKKLKIQYRNLKLTYFPAYFAAIFGDWLQGPYVYKLYSEYGFQENQIAIFFLTGFGSSFTFGTFTGPLADKFGRKSMTQVFCLLYSLSCVIKFSSNFWILIGGRICAGIATSLLFSVFESWYIRQHRDVAKLPTEWMEKTFATTTFANGFLAIVAGIVANILADNLGYGARAPFALGVVCFLFCFIIVTFAWDENYGNKETELISSYKHGLRLILSNRRIFLLGLIQSIIESCMYIFVFLWTPVLTSPSASTSPPLGMIFSCFMLCIMIGSSTFSLFMSKGCSTESTLQISAATFAGCMSLTAATAAPWATDNMRILSLICFLVLETSIGLYFPSIGCLRSELIPEECRATVTNWFRVPMNLITCVTLLAINHPVVAADKRPIFATCTGLLITAVVVCSKFSSIQGKHQKMPASRIQERSKTE